MSIKEIFFKKTVLYSIINYMDIKETKNFIKLGRSWAMIFPPYFLKILGINPETDKMNLSIEEDKIIIEKLK